MHLIKNLMIPLEVDHQNRDHINRINDFFQNCSRGESKEIFYRAIRFERKWKLSALPGTDSD
jgi:hypothetical protein